MIWQGVKQENGIDLLVPCWVLVELECCIRLTGSCMHGVCLLFVRGPTSSH